MLPYPGFEVIVDRGDAAREDTISSAFAQLGFEDVVAAERLGRVAIQGILVLDNIVVSGSQ